MKKRDTKTFFRTFLVTGTLLLCPILTFLGFCKAYEGIMLVGFCRNVGAVDFLADGSVDVLGINIDFQGFGILQKIKGGFSEYCPLFIKIIGQCVNTLTDWLNYLTKFINDSI